jgi:hypothetical protein
MRLFLLAWKMPTENVCLLNLPKNWNASETRPEKRYENFGKLLTHTFHKLIKNRQQNGITRCSQILKMDNQQTPETKSHVCALSLDMTGDCMICAIERERDDAREQYNDLATEHVLAVNKLAEERDAALMDRASGDIATMTINHYERLIKERDEAREAIPAGEWVAYEDHQKVHDAASRLLVAINKQLPIGCFILVSSEYYRLQNAIYGKEGAK